MHSLLSYENSSSDDEQINFAPPVVDLKVLKTNKEAPTKINANLPLAEQNLALAPKSNNNIEEISITDAIWQDTHYKKQEKKKKKHHHKNKREIPWDESAPPKQEATITERSFYQQRQSQRTWFTTIGDDVFEDTYVWYNVINIKDRQGRSWVCPPLSFGHPDPNHECFLPKTKLHKFTFHTSDITDVEMFPVYGHMVLTSSLDCTVRIWSLLGDRQCIQSYMGHIMGVRDVSFRYDGFRFASCCYGKRLKLWDTEYGKMVFGFTLEGIPTQLEMNLDSESGEKAIVSQEDGRIPYYDFRISKSEERKAVCVFEGHTGVVSAIQWLPNYNYFVSAGEDDRLILWDIRNNSEPVKILTHQYLKNIRALTTHPLEPILAAQIRGGEIATIASDTLTLKEKSFTGPGFKTETYPCRFSFSPDGSFLTSGDASGSVWIWKWSDCTLRKTFDCHEKAICKAQWSPFNPSQIITASYDNTMCLLD